MGRKTGTPKVIWSVETSTAHSAIDGSSFELNQEAVNDTLQRLDMPEEAGQLQIVGILPDELPTTTHAPDFTYTVHQLPVLPKHDTDFTEESLRSFNHLAAHGLMNIVDYHKNRLGIKEKNDGFMGSTSRRIGAAAVTGLSIFTTNAVLASEGAEAYNHGWIAVPAVLGAGVTALYAFDCYRDRAHEADKHRQRIAQTDRELMANFIASGPHLVIHRAGGQL